MSEISVLSKQYEQLVSLSSNFNDSVIAYKKKKLVSEGLKRKYPKLTVSEEAITQAKLYLLAFLGNLYKILQDKSYTTEYLPSIIFDDYRKRLETISYIKEDLKALIESLESKDLLDNEQIELLDKLLSELDSEKTILYKKLRAGRA